MSDANTPFNPGLSFAGAVDLEAVKHRVEAKEGEPLGAPAASGWVVDTTEALFESVIRSSSQYPVLLRLWTKSDDRCFGIARVLGEAVNAAEGRILLSRVDIEESAQIAQALRASAIPSLYAILSGRPVPLLQGIPSADELEQLSQALVPQIIASAEQSGISGIAPRFDSSETEETCENPTGGEERAETVPQAHLKADNLAKSRQYELAAEEYSKLIRQDRNDLRAVKERAKCLLLSRSAEADIASVRSAAADNPDSLESQLAVADIDMLGGQIEDAFARLLDFLASHKSEIEPIRERLLEYFAIPDSADPRVAKARRRLATLMY